MKHTILPRNYLCLSKIGIGTVSFGMNYGFNKKMTQEEINKILDKADKLGINFLDTSPAYGDSEIKIGNYLTNCDPGKAIKFIISTKMEIIKKDTQRTFNSFINHIFFSIEKSMDKLNTEKIDLFQPHQTSPWLLKNENFWGAVKSAKQKNLFSAFGLSVYDPKETEEYITKHPKEIDFIQLPYSIADRRFEPLFSKLGKLNIGIIGRSALLRGTLTEPKTPKKLKELTKIRNSIVKISKHYRYTPAELCVFFATKPKQINSTIIGVKYIQELEEINCTANRLIKNKEISEIYNKIREIKPPDYSLIDPRNWRIT